MRGRGSWGRGAPAWSILVALALASGGPGRPARAASSPFHSGGRTPAPDGSAASGTGAFPDALPRYHDGEQVLCADCHVLHASQSHAYVGVAPGAGAGTPYAASPNPSLLRAPDALDLCLGCHDGRTFAPDVLDLDANGLLERSAGHFAEPGAVNPRGHDLGRGLAGASGSDLCNRCHLGGGEGAKVTCIDCHEPHGNGVARNLRWASLPEATPDLGLLVNPGAAGMARYEALNVSYGTLDANTLREPTSMCIDCHHVSSGGGYVDPDGNGIHSRHPSYDSERGSPNSIALGGADGGSDPGHWESGVGSGFGDVPRLRFVAPGATSYAAGRVVDAESNGVFCLTCHAAHGSDRAFALRIPLRNGYAAPGCDQCHGIARAAGGGPGAVESAGP